jgi:hypothetical protein
LTREEHRTVVTNDPLAAQPVASETHHVVETQPSGGEVARRVIVLVFGIIQILILIRIVLLLIGANQAQPLVDFILTLSTLFVAPFEGILGTDAVGAGGSVLDMAAVLALLGWTALEAVLLWATNVFRREPA